MLLQEREQICKQTLNKHTVWDRHWIFHQLQFLTMVKTEPHFYCFNSSFAPCNQHSSFPHWIILSKLLFVIHQMAFDLNGLFKSTTSQFCDFCRLPVTLEGPASHMSLGLDCWRRPSVTTTVTKHRTNVPFCQPSGLFYLFFFLNHCRHVMILGYFSISGQCPVLTSLGKPVSQ